MQSLHAWRMLLAQTKLNNFDSLTSGSAQSSDHSLSLSNDLLSDKIPTKMKLTVSLIRKSLRLIHLQLSLNLPPAYSQSADYECSLFS